MCQPECRISSSTGRFSASTVAVSGVMPPSAASRASSRQPGADPAPMVTVRDLEGDLRVVGAFRDGEVLCRADEEGPVERPDGQVVGADGDEARDVSRCERADEPK